MKTLKKITIYKNKENIIKRIMSCILSAVMLFMAINILNFIEHKEIIGEILRETVKVSAKTVKSQITCISEITTKTTISIFAVKVKQEETVKPISKEKESDKKSSTKEGNSLTASVLYLIISGISVVNEALKSLGVVWKITETKFVEYLKNMSYISSAKEINIIFVMLILMSIIMARRNIGEKNNKKINKEVIGIKK